MRRENMGGSNPGRRAARRGPGVPGAEGPSRRIPHASRSAARSASPSGTGEEGRPGGRGIKRFSGAEKGRIATGNQPGKKVVRREAPLKNGHSAGLPWVRNGHAPPNAPWKGRLRIPPGKS